MGASEIYQKHKQKSIGSYISWRTFLYFNIREPIIARQCIEHILKSIVVREKILGITTFGFKELQDLKDRGDIPKRFKTFGSNACLHLIRKYKNNLLTPEIETCINEIIDIGNKSGHEVGDDELLKLVKTIDQHLLNVANWFFIEQEKDTKWEKDYIIPEIKRIIDVPAKEAASEIARHLNEFLDVTENNKAETDESQLTVTHLEKILSKFDELHDKITEKNAENTESTMAKHSGAILEKIENTEKSHWKKIVLIALPITALLLTIYFLSATYSENTAEETNETEKINDGPFDTTKKDSYNVLLLPFERKQADNERPIKIEQEIRDKLLKMNSEDGLNLQVYLDFDFHFDSTGAIDNFWQADSFGTSVGAHLIIWGDLYQHCSNDNEVCIKFTSTHFQNSFPTYEISNESEIKTFSSLTEIKSGKLLRDIDYIIYFVTALRFSWLNDPATALKYLKKIEQSENNPGELLTFIGQSYARQGFLDSAKIYYEKSLLQNPDDVSYICEYAESLEYFCGDTVRTRLLYENALQIDSNYIPALLGYGDISYETKDLYKAKKYYEKALALDSNYSPLHFNYGSLLSKLNNGKLAKKHYKKAFELDSTILDYCLEAAHHTLSDTIAKEFLDIAFFLQPENPLVHVEYAILFDNRYSDTLQARQHFEMAIKLDSLCALAHVNYAGLMGYRFNDLKAAKKHYLKAIFLDSAMKNEVIEKLLGLNKL